MASIQTYLIFDGSCEEAVKFYCDIFNGKVSSTSRYGEVPGDIPNNWKEKIIHTTFTLRDAELMASDTHPNQPVIIGNNNHISVNFKMDEKIDEMFNKLAAGGKITMPLQKTFWNAYFGMLTDCYGINWMFNQNLNE